MNTRTELINHIINKSQFNSYLEIGLRDPNENFNKININNKTSVDPSPMGSCDYIMTSDNFFKILPNNVKYDLIFIDGLHTSNQVYVDIQNSMEHLNDDGIIVVHDCNPLTEYHTRSYENYLLSRGQWNGDVFKGFIKYKNENLYFSCFVINIDFGCGIISKKNILENIIHECDINEINWNYFELNRNNLLQLVNVDDFIIFY